MTILTIIVIFVVAITSNGPSHVPLSAILLVIILSLISAGSGVLYLIRPRFFPEELKETISYATRPEVSLTELDLSKMREQLALDAKRLELDRKRLDLAKERTDYALETAYKFAEALQPEADQSTKEQLIHTLLPQLLRSLQAENWELTMPEEHKDSEKVSEE